MGVKNVKILETVIVFIPKSVHEEEDIIILIKFTLTLINLA